MFSYLVRPFTNKRTLEKLRPVDPWDWYIYLQNTYIYQHKSTIHVGNKVYNRPVERTWDMYWDVLMDDDNPYISRL